MERLRRKEVPNVYARANENFTGIQSLSLPWTPRSQCSQLNALTKATALSPTINSLYTEIYFLQVLLRLLHEPYLHFCYEIALETSAKCSSIKSLRVHDLCHAHSLVRLQWSGPPTSERFSRLKTVYSPGNGAHKEAEEPYLPH